MNKINNIIWDSAKLKISIAGEIEGHIYYISDGEKKYTFLQDGEWLILNMMNVSDELVVGEGNWSFYCDNQKMLEIDLDCAEKLSELSRVFKYGLGLYAYTVDFGIAEKEFGLTCSMHTNFYMHNKNPKKRNYIAESETAGQFLAKYLNHLCEKAINVLFISMLFMRKRPSNKILLMSETRTPISGNLKALDQRIKEKYSDKINVTYYFDKTLEHNKVRIFAGWIKLCWKIAGSSYVFVDDYSPIFKFIDLKGKVKLIQLWHAGVGFKAVGYARFGKDGSPYPYESGHRKYDYVVVGSEELISIYSEVFGLPEDRFLPYGLPRLDGYMDEKKKEYFRAAFYQKYPELRDKKIILFAPTYRGTTQKEAYYPYEKLESQVLKRLGERGYVFGIKMHPFVKKKFDIAEDLKNIVYDFSDYNDINDLFYITDILITDYSSNIYEFALFRKPIIFYAYDYREYKLTRGMQTDLKELGVGRVCAEFKEVEEIIEKQDFNMSGIDEYIRRNHCVGAMSASDAIINNIILSKTR